MGNPGKENDLDCRRLARPRAQFRALQQARFLMRPLLSGGTLGARHDRVRIDHSREPSRGRRAVAQSTRAMRFSTPSQRKPASGWRFAHAR